MSPRAYTGAGGVPPTAAIASWFEAFWNVPLAPVEASWASCEGGSAASEMNTGKAAHRRDRMRVRGLLAWQTVLGCVVDTNAPPDRTDVLVVVIGLQCTGVCCIARRWCCR